MAAKTLTLILLSLSISISSSSHVSLSVSPKTLTKSNNTVNLHWTGVESPSDLDFLAIYSPPDSADKDFIGYVFLNSSSDFLTGSGFISLPLTNLRSNYGFRIFRWTRNEVSYRHLDHDRNPLPLTKHKLAVSEEVGFEKGWGPEQVHLALTEREGEMRVMKGLESGKRYYYQVGSETGGWSPIHSFISQDNSANETIAFLFGDMGTSVPYSTFYRTQYESRSTAKWILRDIESLGDKPALVSHVGDISYARGFSWIWDEFFNMIEPIASRVPYHVCIGNHEYNWPLQPWRPSWSYGVYGKDGGGECGVPYSLKFKMPGNSSLPTGTGAPDTQNLYYSFDAGVVHFLYISTETNFLKGSDQYNFIKADLESVSREKTPFVVVQGHRPMYTTSNELRDTPMRKRMVENLEQLLVDNNVTLALWGHVHTYERFCPIKNNVCADVSSNFTYKEGSPVHVVIGMGGQDWQGNWEPRPDHTDVPIFPQPERSMYRGGEFGYTRLVATREKLTLAYVGNHDGEIHDIVEISSGLTQNFCSAGEVVVESTIPTYVIGGSILIFGAFVGFFLGFVTRCKRDGTPRNTWTPVKSEEA